MKIGVGCVICGGPVSPTRHAGRPRVDMRFCSHGCYLKRKKVLNPVERFWKSVNKFGPMHPILKGRCWVWTGSRGSKGHGDFSIGRAQNHVKAHRFSWRLCNGEIPEGLCVLHSCDNPPCVNPEHLFLGTVADNNADMVAKNRQQQGEGHYEALLSVEDVLEIRRSYRPYCRRNSFGALARRFGVSIKTVENAAKGITWKGVKEDKPCA